MSFKRFCFEMWMENQEENPWQREHATSYLRRNRWFLKRRYRQIYGNLQPEWKKDLTNAS